MTLEQVTTQYIKPPWLAGMPRREMGVVGTGGRGGGDGGGVDADKTVRSGFSANTLRHW